MDSPDAAEGSAVKRHRQFIIMGNKKRYIEVIQCSGEDMNLVLTSGISPNLPSSALPQPQTNGLTPGGITPGGLTPGGLTPGGLTPGALNHLNSLAPGGLGLPTSNAGLVLPPHHPSAMGLQRPLISPGI